MKLVVAITGASGVLYAKNFLEAAKGLGIETHLIITDSGRTVATHELGGVEQLKSLADYSYDPEDLEAPIASGSFRVNGMVIVPASMKTVAALAHGYNENLVTRAADVHLKERRPLVVVPRETPLHAVHLENMATLSRLGAVILPAMPGFYHDPKSIDDLATFISGKILDQLGVENHLYRRWGEP
ncbi:UbiX family flavin prenyltransferase [Candidatus Bathyarchaeota archaeon]|nr:UbiX family flavin prenyltransferase [Candidatus Bathyarchaeota archaeon]